MATPWKVYSKDPDEDGSELLAQFALARDAVSYAQVVAVEAWSTAPRWVVTIVYRLGPIRRLVWTATEKSTASRSTDNAYDTSEKLEALRDEAERVYHMNARLL